MRSNHLYYHLKPYLPWSLRMGVRRFLARRKLRVSSDVWPISEAAGKKPEGWPGWPDGKKFALVLTHDVERSDGLARCPQLMALEKEKGFRSSFNFVPEGDYSVPGELRKELLAGGFEIGVHDLHHDGKLYRTRHEFAEKARRINQYLAESSACGFRSGFMLHNLDWLLELNVKYDASTFDTDPFEPQPDGANTIFPFWVPGNRSSGYIELPYTLPQDSTLFLLLREKNIDIWKRKLDWVVQRGGMALVNTHPDYMSFGEHRADPQRYPYTLYRELLEYVQARYKDQYWHALPREVADYCAPIRPRRPASSSKRVCMITHSVYQRDNRVMRYAKALAERGDQVEVISLKSDPSQLDEEREGLVRVLRVQGRYQKNQKSKGDYLLPLLRFLFISSWRLGRNHLRSSYDFVHVHNVPDFLVFAAWLPKLFGAKIILDIHDIVPEFYASKFQQKGRRTDVRMLERVERASAGFANHVIISNHLWFDKYTSRSAAPSKCSVFVNHVDEATFFRRERNRNDDRLIVLFPGGLQWHQGLDIAIKGFARVAEHVPSAVFHIYGEGNMKRELIALTKELGLEDKVKFFEPLPIDKIAEVMANSDLGVVPKRADSFGNEAYSTKIMEFMAVGVPVVVSGTKIDRYYFNDSIVRFFESGNSEALADAMLEVLNSPDVRRKLTARASEYVNKNSWEVRKVDYLRLVDSLCEPETVQSSTVALQSNAP